MSTGFNLLNLKDARIRTLHFSWFAFFLTFMLWFSHAPLLGHLKEAFNLSSEQIKALLILNVALTIPARILIGMLVDRFGPRRVYSLLLAAGAVVSALFALSTSWEQLALTRFLLGFVGAGFVIGIRLVGEWFPARQVGLAEGVYGGWGNFGSAAAAMTLPSLALIYGGDNGWRYALLCISGLALAYSVIFYLKVRNTPKGSAYFRPRKSTGLEVSSKRDLYLYIAMNVPMYLALGVLGWKLSPSGVALISESAFMVLVAGLVGLFAFQVYHIVDVNRERLRHPVPEMDRYSFSQVAVLDWAYFVTFGSELAVVSMLPLFFMETFGLDAVKAGLLASGFAFMNLVARPGGGWISDKLGRKKTLTVLIGGLMVGYLVLSQVDGSWWIPVAVLATMACSFFVQAGEGAVFAMVPLVKRRLTRQIAGMVGAYGNVGGVTFLTVLSFVDASTFFLVIAGAAAVCLVLVQFVREPEGHIAEVHEDGRVELIEVA